MTISIHGRTASEAQQFMQNVLESRAKPSDSPEKSFCEVAAGILFGMNGKLTDAPANGVITAPTIGGAGMMAASEIS